MLGTICFRLCNCVSSLHAYRPPTITYKHVASTNVYRLRWNRISSLQRFGLSLKRPCNCCCSNGTRIAQHEPSILDADDSVSEEIRSSWSNNFKQDGGSHTYSFTHFLGLGFPSAFYHKNIGRSNVASCLIDGSWNVAWDSRPARWLHGQHSAWLAFGVCTCYSRIHFELATKNDIAEDRDPPSIELEKGSNISRKPAQGKQALENYEVISIPGDGRCLFRAVSYGACLRNGEGTPDKDTQRELADQLRDKVVDELISRRADSEWFIEADFDDYVKRMRKHDTWGGEPELLMASHVLKMPITVYLNEESSWRLISIAEYGLEYGTENPIKVVYHGSGHYNLIQHPLNNGIQG